MQKGADTVDVTADPKKTTRNDRLLTWGVWAYGKCEGNRAAFAQLVEDCDQVTKADALDLGAWFALMMRDEQAFAQVIGMSQILVALHEPRIDEPVIPVDPEQAKREYEQRYGRDPHE